MSIKIFTNHKDIFQIILFCLFFIFKLVDCKAQISLDIANTIYLETTSPLVGKIYDIDISDHQIFIADYDNHCIWVFDMNGHYVNHFGERGQGPGELMYPLSVNVLDDTIAVLERGNRRAAFFTLQGEFCYTIPVGIMGALSGLIQCPKSGKIFISESLGLTHFQYFNRKGETRKPAPVPHYGIRMPVDNPGGHSSLMRNGSILFSYIRNYHVAVLDWEGQILHEIYDKNPQFVPPALASQKTYLDQTEQSIALLPLHVEDNIVIQWMHSQKDKNGTMRNETVKFFVDIYSSDGSTIIQNLTHEKLPAIYTDGKFMYSVDYSGLKNNSSLNPALIALSIKE